MVNHYCMAQNFGGVKFWRINRFMSFDKENVGKFTIANISYFSGPGIWLGKILANGIHFAKFAKVFSHQNFALYGRLFAKIKPIYVRISW